MIDARARALQLKGARAGETVALPAARGIQTAVNVAALWSLGSSPMMIRATPSSPVLGETAIRAKVNGILDHDGEYVQTNIGGKLRPYGTAPALILNPFAQPDGMSIPAKTAAQLADLTQLAQEIFSVSDRTVLALSDGANESFAFETWAVLANGGTVDMIDDFTARNAATLVRFLNESAIDLVYLTPSDLHLLSTAGETHAAATGVRDVIVPHDAGATNGLIARYFPSAKIHHLRVSPSSGWTWSLVNCA
jgi:non-ribosomal peptide synthetase component F